MNFGKKYGALLEAIAKQGDAIAMRYFRSDGLRIEKKGDGTAVTQADRAVEEMARAKVAASGLGLVVLGEEMGGENAKSPNAAGQARLIIDPIDGTEEFTRGVPTFGTLLGIELNGEIVAGMVSAPGIARRWWAYRGEGAWYNGKRIHVSDVSELNQAMVFSGGTGPNKNREKIDKMRRLMDAARHGRSLGGFWQHMLVAEGAVEVALDMHSRAWDLAPIGIIVEEAGGRATDVNGVRTIYNGTFVSTNGKIHEEVLKLLQ